MTVTGLNELGVDSRALDVKMQDEGIYDESQVGLASRFEFIHQLIDGILVNGITGDDIGEALADIVLSATCVASTLGFDLEALLAGAWEEVQAIAKDELTFHEMEKSFNA
jgi:hypothetical protein